MSLWLRSLPSAPAVKPSLDVTVQGNFGDDELDSTAEWDNVAWQSNYSSEFIDNFTYGATLSVTARPAPPALVLA